jgi:hypothetical protein
MDDSIVMLQGTPQKGDKPAQRKTLRREGAPAPARHLREAPAQQQPHVWSQ